MATLEKIRSRASLMIFVIACALLCFIVGDFLNNSFSILHRNENVVGVVNGEKIDRFEFEDSYRQLSEVFKYQQRNQAEDAEIRAAAFENFKQKVLINSEAQADGLAVTKGELTDATIGNHPHSLLLRSGFFVNQNGVFSSDIVKRFIDDVNRDPNTISNPDERAQFMARQEQVRNIWLYTENTVKQSLLVDKIGALLNNALSAPKAEADFIAALSSKESDALVARKLFADVNDADVQVADADLLAYYNAHKNDFKRESYRNMQIIMFPIGPSKQDLKEEFDVMDSLRSQLRSTSDNEKLQLLFQSSSERNYQFSNVYITPNSYDPAFTEFAKTATSGQVSDIVSDEMQGLFKCAKALANPVTRPDSVRFSLIAVQEADTVATQARADSIAKAARTGADFAKLADRKSVV